jgi:hypothetical protein
MLMMQESKMKLAAIILLGVLGLAAMVLPVEVCPWLLPESPFSSVLSARVGKTNLFRMCSLFYRQGCAHLE